MSVNTDYMLKCPFFVNLYRAALKPFRLKDFTSDGKTSKVLGATLLTKNLSLCKKKAKSFLPLLLKLSLL